MGPDGVRWRAWANELWSRSKDLAERFTDYIACEAPVVIDAVQWLRRTALMVWPALRRLCAREPWIGGALVSAALFAVTFTVHRLLGNPSGIEVLYLLPIWLGTRLSGPIVGFSGVAVVSLVLADLDPHSGNSIALFQPNGLLRLASLTALMLVISHVECRLHVAQREARHDALTGVLNRAEIERRIGEALKQWRAHGRSVSIALVDCDGFKQINDRMGHAFGDYVLRVLARRLQSVSRNQGVVGRLGGDEFVVLYEGLAADDARARMASGAFLFSKFLSGTGVQASFSYGVAEVGEPTDSVARLFEVADARMYARKRGIVAQVPERADLPLSA